MMIPASIIVNNIKARLKKHDGVLVVALDGKSGVGKTTLANDVANELDAANILSDDFFVGGHNKDWAAKSTKEKIDKVIDWRRIKREVLEPLKAGKTATWRPFDWKKFEGLSSKTITANPKRVVILDGAFSSREELSDVVDYRILVEAPSNVRVNRVVEREGEEYSEDWHSTWQEAMDYYFEKIRPPESFDLVVRNH
jgi:uridine kinase